MKRCLLLLALLFLPLSVSATTTLVRVGSCSGTTSCTPPAHQAGDLFIGYAFRNNSTTAPSLPAGWVDIHSLAGLGTASDRITCKTAVTSGETATGFTNATGFILLVYRGSTVTGNFSLDCSTLSVGGSTANAASGSSTISYNGVTLTDTNNTSWIIGCAGSVSATNVNQAPMGMTLVTSASSNQVACSDTNATASTWTTKTVGVNASADWQSFTMEIRACTTFVCLRSITQNFGSGSGTMISSPVAAHGSGNKLIVLIANATASFNISSVVNTAGDTFALCTGTRQSTIRHTEIWETTNVPIGNGIDAVTVTFASSDTNRTIGVMEVSGLKTTACEAGAAGSAGSGTTFSTSNFSPVNAGNYNVGTINPSAGAITMVGTNYTLTSNTTGEQLIGASAGSQAVTFTTTLSASCGVSGASFQATNSGGAGRQIGVFLVGP